MATYSVMYHVRWYGNLEYVDITWYQSLHILLNWMPSWDYISYRANGTWRIEAMPRTERRTRSNPNPITTQVLLPASSQLIPSLFLGRPTLTKLINRSTPEHMEAVVMRFKGKYLKNRVKTLQTEVLASLINYACNFFLVGKLFGKSFIPKISFHR